MPGVLHIGVWSKSLAGLEEFAGLHEVTAWVRMHATTWQFIDCILSFLSPGRLQSCHACRQESRDNYVIITDPGAHLEPKRVRR